MTDSYILVQGTAQKIDTRQVTTGSGTVERQVGAIGDPLTGGAVANVGPGVASGGLRVTISTDQQTQTPGGSIHHKVSAATTNATVIKASRGKIIGFSCYNTNNSIRKVAFHNTASTPTAGTTAIVWAVVVPANGSAVVHLPPEGIEFSSGIAYTMVTGVADSNSTAVGASELVMGVVYV